MNVTSLPRLYLESSNSRRESVPSTTTKTFPPGMVWTSVETTRACLFLNRRARLAMMPSVPLALGAVASRRRMGDSGPES